MPPDANLSDDARSPVTSTAPPPGHGCRRVIHIITFLLLLAAFFSCILFSWNFLQTIRRTPLTGTHTVAELPGRSSHDAQPLSLSHFLQALHSRHEGLFLAPRPSSPHRRQPHAISQANPFPVTPPHGGKSPHEKASH